VSDGVVESDPRSPTCLISYLENKKQRHEGRVITGGLAKPNMYVPRLHPRSKGSGAGRTG
jgi:hypothetical protein